MHIYYNLLGELYVSTECLYNWVWWAYQIFSYDFDLPYAAGNGIK